MCDYANGQPKMHSLLELELLMQIGQLSADCDTVLQVKVHRANHPRVGVHVGHLVLFPSILHFAQFNSQIII